MMKRIIIFLLMVLPIVVIAQNDTTKYYKSNDYGWTYQRLKTLKALIPPTDTTTNKLGLAVIGWNVYVGNGTSWSTVAGGGGSFYDSVLMASTQRLKDTAAVLRAYGESLAATKISSTRTLTINGVSYDLSSNRSWNVGTVTQSQLDDTASAIRAAIGSGGGSGISGLTTNRVPYATSSTTIGDDAGMTYNATTNELTTDSVKGKAIYGDSGVFVPQGRYDYDNSFWRPGIRFIGENKTGIARLAGITTFIDNGNKNVGIWREGADTDVIFGYGANRLTVEATGSMNHVSLVGRMEFEGLGNGGYIDWVGYQAGSAIGRTIRITTDAAAYGNSVVPIHFVPRNGFHAFRITDSVNAVKMHFSSQGWLGIGNDTAQRAIHVRNNGDVYERLESLSLTGIIGHEYYVQGNEKWSNKIDVNSGQITENIGTGGYFKRWSVNGTNAIGLDADRTVFINNRLFVGATSSLGIGEKLAVNGTIALADGNQVVEPSGISGFRISTSAGTDIFYGSGATQGKVQVNPHMSYIYNSVEKFRVSSAGELWINPSGVSDLGAFTLQNTGGLYQNGVFSLRGTNASSSPYSILFKQSDSSVSQLAFTGSTSDYLRADGTFATPPGGSGLPSQTGNAGKYLTTDGTNASWATVSGGGATDLSASYSASDVTVASSTGLDATISAATTSNAGVMSSAMKVKLDSTITSITLSQDSITVFKRADGTEAFRDTLTTFYFTKSIVEVGGNQAQLVNDETSPGNNEYYGTDGSGTKGYFANVDGMTDYHNAVEALGSTHKAQTVGYPLQYCNTSSNLTDNQIRYTAVYLNKAQTLTGVKVYVRVAGSYTGDQTNAVALYSYSGGTMTKVAESANTATLWTSTANAIQTIAFSSTYAAQPGIYYVGILYNNSAQTTAPALATGTALNNAAMASLDFTNSAKLYGTVSTQNSFPATQAMSGVTGATAPTWVAVY